MFGRGKNKDVQKLKPPFISLRVCNGDGMEIGSFQMTNPMSLPSVPVLHIESVSGERMTVFLETQLRGY